MSTRSEELRFALEQIADVARAGCGRIIEDHTHAWASCDMIERMARLALRADREKEESDDEHGE